MRNTILIAALAVVGTASAQSLYNNATPAGLTAEGLRTGSRPAGGSYSEVQLGNTVAGFSVGNSAGTQFRLADDFSVSGPGWNVSSVVMFAYNTGATTPTITFGQAEIRTGSVSGAVVGTLTYGNTVFTDIYRIFNATPGDTRRVQQVTFNYSGPSLAAGNYFLTYNLGNTANNLNPFNPTLTKVGSTGTPGANALQFDGVSNWVSIVDTNSLAAQDLPFWINGEVVPEPASMIALGAGIAALVARRKKA